ncbi:TonB-linked outer membrane protein, SusC/RagA family [Mariniphaga anaerophila]|uniref:TonB-linked outer membrane protein, SusC/RagA family n=1 Tax=Mariniphaga anaerophila TaxID=1484053 RepID=A0A1M5CSF5_9BACT|nr:TonB-dependent receptor [Mariniphaga anaerophila]SHF57683.1 TonB-linked outer membrane protein, SusC/RagA family [Mariniphaga anaerophila]
MKKLLLLSLFLCTSVFFANAQTKQITGTVTSKSDGSPIPGVSVVVSGTSTGTITDVDGNFSLRVPENETLLFSFVGMKTVEVPITESALYNVAMEQDVIGMDEVLVVAYGTSKRSSFTGSAQKVGAEELVGTSTSESIDKMLSGKVSGVRVSSTTGAPGASGEVQIRGVGSINASTTPLYVIDGVPMEIGMYGYTGFSTDLLSTLNPEDVESMTILKDAAAASLYGSRAANGVVLITTKKGKSGKTQFKFKATYGTSETAMKNVYQPMSAEQYVDYVNDALIGAYLFWYEPGLYPDDPGYQDAEVLERALQYVQEDPDEGKWGITSPSANTNWRDVVYKKGNTMDYQFSASGGNDKTTFYTGVGYNKIEGIVIGSDFERYSGRINLDHKATDWLNFSLKQMLSHTSQNGYGDQTDQVQGINHMAPLGMIFSMNPTQPVYNEDGTPNQDAGMGNVKNPLTALIGTGERTDQTYILERYRSLTNASVRMQLIPEFAIRSNFGVDYSDSKTRVWWAPESVDGEAYNGLGDHLTYTTVVKNASFIGDFNKSFGKHNIQVFGGYEAEGLTYRTLQANAENYSTYKLPELANGQALAVDSEVASSNLMSFIGNMNYNFADKYYASASIRSDGSSRLGANNRWGNFWSASAAWRITQEEFMGESSWLNDLKIRASFGTNGTLPVDYFAHSGLYTFSSGYGSESAIYTIQPDNPDLSWEKSDNFNVGLDLRVFDKLTASVEYYHKKTRDLLMLVPLTYLTGFETSWQNLGELTNKGLEFEVHSNNIVTSDFRWTTDFNLTTISSVIDKLPAGKDVLKGDGGMYLLREGEAINTFYLPTYAGVDPDNGMPLFYLDPENSDELTYLRELAKPEIQGKPTPDLIGGMTNTFVWKGLELSFLLTYQMGGSLFDYPGYFFHHDGVRLGSMNLAKDVENNWWKKPGDIVDNPRPVAWTSDRPDRWSSRHVLSTDHIRLKDIYLGYSLPKSVVSKMHMSNLKVFVNGNNIWTLAKEDTIEPEVTLNGYRTVDTPITKNFLFGINVEF